MSYNPEDGDGMTIAPNGHIHINKADGSFVHLNVATPEQSELLRSLDYGMERAGTRLANSFADESKTADAKNADANKLKPAKPVREESFWRDGGWRLLIIAMLALAIAGNEEINFLGLSDALPYGYYMLLRFACCAAFALWAFKAHEQGKMFWRNCLAILAVAYNPFLPIHLGHEVWAGVNMGTVMLVIATGIILRVHTEEEIDLEKLKARRRAARASKSEPWRKLPSPHLEKLEILDKYAEEADLQSLSELLSSEKSQAIVVALALACAALACFILA